ncbi:DNA-binding protein [Paeniglutamicibacter kerguelensis]|uniref:Flap endonuclease-1-like 5' DNA nuclease n=1 Tax=Paeniglutamicibacter kerguelensis TaxID=254788 RepID=A0ABS4XIL0_9MICC|nr:DNA-binding protein [Paeniglutamicibacter kerguelensis]MBP2388151.1 putative flap endonuclease-1-like 5' DNA nuclease [Paeniglutamicibacter kerguelensis]
MSDHELPKIGAPATGALKADGITTLEQAAARGEKELLAMHGVGPKAIRILREALQENGSELAE